MEGGLASAARTCRFPTLTQGFSASGEVRYASTRARIRRAVDQHIGVMPTDIDSRVARPRPDLGRPRRSADLLPFPLSPTARFRGEGDLSLATNLLAGAYDIRPRQRCRQ